MSYGCLSGSCSDNLFSQLALPHTHTHKCMHQHEQNPQFWKGIKADNRTDVLLLL